MLGPAATHERPLHEHYARVIAALEALPPLQEGAQQQGGAGGGEGTGARSPSELAAALRLPSPGRSVLWTHRARRALDSRGLSVWIGQTLTNMGDINSSALYMHEA